MLCSQVLGHCGHPCGRFFACLLVTALNLREVSDWFWLLRGESGRPNAVAGVLVVE